MDAQNIQSEKNYAKGFNAGYLLEKHEPELMKQIMASPNDRTNEYYSGLQDGKKQHDKEKILAQMKQAQEKGKDREREK
jgi:hypothetical protein